MVDDSTPVNRVIQLRAQGLTNAQIIDMLQREGYNPNQIFDAMNQADIKGEIKGAPEPQEMKIKNPIDPSQAQPQMIPQNTIQQPIPAQQTLQQPIQQNTAQPDYYPYSENVALDAETEKIEEIAEAIIDEKWNEIIESVNKVIDWKNRTEARIVKLEQQISDLKKSFAELQKGILDKVSEYDQHILDVGTELKAMETVFKKVLPTFTQNVNQLSDIVKKLKEK